MPDVSNEDLMKLIYRVIKKVDILEEKLDRLLVEREEKLPLKTVDHGFSFTPISNDKELQTVTKKIQHEAYYKENLQNFLQNQGEFTLEDIFQPEYLQLFSYHGVKGMKKMEGLVAYEQIFVSLKSLGGFTFETIKVMAMQQIYRCKKRISNRNLSEKYRQALETEKSKNLENVEMDNEPPRKTQKLEENVSMDSDEEDLDEETLEPESGQVVIEVYQEIDHEDKDDDETDEDGVNFHPIKNDEQLEKVTQKIETNPQYLKNLRIKIVEESEDGQCSLTQIFSERFLGDCTLFGLLKNKKLITMVPYKEVYYYLKSHMGLSAKEIERQAMDELNKVKKRVARLRAKEALKHQTKS